MGASVIEVRRVHPDEWPALKCVRLAMLRDTPNAFVTTIDEALAQDDQLWIDRARAGSLGDAQLTVLAFDREVATGMAVGLRRARYGEPVLVVVSVYLAESLRGSGVADEMFRQLEEWGSSWGAGQSTLWVEEGNRRAAGFYEKIGYVLTLDRAKISNDSGLWEARMEKALEPIS